MTIPKHQTVPAEPTQEMLAAAFRQAEENLRSALGNSHCKTNEERSAHAIRPLWHAMLAAAPPPPETIDIVFDGPPGLPDCCFVDIEAAGKSINFGEWVKRPDGYWALRISPPEDRMLAEAWQPIDTAPEDGTEVLGHIWSEYRKAGTYVLVSYDARSGEFLDEYGGHARDLVSWQPLPAPPRLRAQHPKATGGR